MPNGMLFLEFIFTYRQPYFMRFNDRNNALHLLGSENTYTVAIPTESVGFSLAVSFMDHEFEGMKPLFRKSIQYLCKPFLEAFSKTEGKLFHALQRESIHKSGTLICPGAGDMPFTTFYDLDTKHNGKQLTVNGTVLTFANVPNTSLSRD